MEFSHSPSPGMIATAVSSFQAQREISSMPLPVMEGNRNTAYAAIHFTSYTGIARSKPLGINSLNSENGNSFPWQWSFTN